MESPRAKHLVGISMLLGLFLPHTSYGLMIINPLLVVLLFFITNNKHSTGFGTLKYLLCGVVIVSLLSSLLFLYHNSNKYLLSSFYFLLLWMCFPFNGPQRIPSGYYYLAVCIILFSQLIYIFNLPFLQKQIETLYPVGDSELSAFEYMTENINATNFFNYRLGGLFRNQNQSARYICLITAAFLADRPNWGLRKTGLFILLALVSVVLTGSRTGLIVISLTLGVYTLGSNAIPRMMKVLFVVLCLAVIIPLFISGSQLIRGLNVSQGLKNSANLKWDVLKDYLSQDNSFFHLLFGYGDSDTFHPTNPGVMPFFDSEYGDMIYTYGFIGFILLILLYAKSFRYCQKENRLFFLVLLWSVTSTVMLSYRMSFLFMLFLSHYISLEKNTLS